VHWFLHPHCQFLNASSYIDYLHFLPVVPGCEYSQFVGTFIWLPSGLEGGADPHRRARCLRPYGVGLNQRGDSPTSDDCGSRQGAPHLRRTGPFVAVLGRALHFHFVIAVFGLNSPAWTSCSMLWFPSLIPVSSSCSTASSAGSRGTIPGKGMAWTNFPPLSSSCPPNSTGLPRGP
jgi:hypothetical protein